MASTEDASSKARERWKFLANVLMKNNNDSDFFTNPVSVRRFPGFSLFKSTERKDCDNSSCDDFQRFEFTSNVRHLASPKIEVTLRKNSIGLQISELSGFDNTGNICIWPSEEVLAYYLLKHKSEFEGLCVCELGAGMTALAGVLLAASCSLSEVCLTDGNEQSVANIKRIIAKNNFDKTKVHASKLIWDENYEPPQDMRNRFDVIVASDCLFYVESHKGLLHTITKLLTPKGYAILMAPRRSGTLQQFCNTAMTYYDVQVNTDYDDLITMKLKEANSLGNDVFDEDLHYPILVRLQQKYSDDEPNNIQIECK